MRTLFFVLAYGIAAEVVGNVTGDGRNDVVLTTAYYFDPDNDYHVFVYPQLEDGTLGTPIKYPHVSTPYQTTAAA